MLGIKEKKMKIVNNDNLSSTIALLGEVRICPFTGKKYDAVIKVRCECECHNPNITALHCFPCCDNGYKEVYRYID